MTHDGRNRNAPARCLAVWSALVAFAAAGPARAGYSLVDLGEIGGGTAAMSIGSDRTIAGYELPDPLKPHATLFANGAIVDLGTLGGDASLATGAASGGRATGWARLPDATRHAFLYQDGVMHDLGTLGGRNSQAFAMNDAGTVVGSSWLADNGEEVPMMWTARTGMTMLPVAQVHGGQALGINDAGTVVGYFIDSLQVQPFEYVRGVSHQLPTLGGQASKAYGVSPAGLIVGYALTPDALYPKFHPVLWQRGVIHDLLPMAGGHAAAYGVNDAGEVVGFSYDDQFRQIAVRWGVGQALDLNDVLPPDSHWRLEIATGLTADGVISGIGEVDGLTRAFALVPDGVDGTSWGLTSGYAMTAYPQPMRTSGTLELTLDRDMSGPLRLYDVTGRRVADLAAGPFGRGHHVLAVPGDVLSRVRSGVYFARLDGELGPLQRRIVIVR